MAEAIRPVRIAAALGQSRALPPNFQRHSQCIAADSMNVSDGEGRIVPVILAAHKCEASNYHRRTSCFSEYLERSNESIEIEIKGSRTGQDDQLVGGDCREHGELLPVVLVVIEISIGHRWVLWRS